MLPFIIKKEFFYWVTRDYNEDTHNLTVDCYILPQAANQD